MAVAAHEGSEKSGGLAAFHRYFPRRC